MAQPPTSMPMSPTSETLNAPLAPVTALQIPSDAAPVKEDVANTSPGASTTILKPPDVTNNDTTSTEPVVDTESTTKRPSLVVHHLNNSRSQRLLWLLEELEVPYEIQKHERNAEMRAPQELKDVHPLGKSPIITDGDVTLAESGAITEYIISKYGGNFQPIDSGKIDNLYFTHYAEGSLMPILVNKLIFSIIPQRSPALIRPLIKPIFSTIDKKLVVPELKAHCALVRQQVGYIESHLEKSKTGWLAGGDHPTSADFMMVFPLESMTSRGSAFVGPKTKEYVKRIHERPAYKRGLERGGKYDYAKL